MKRIDTIKARKLLNILQNLEYLSKATDELSHCHERTAEIIIDGYGIDIDVQALYGFLNQQIELGHCMIEEEFNLDSRS